MFERANAFKGYIAGFTLNFCSAFLKTRTFGISLAILILIGAFTLCGGAFAQSLTLDMGAEGGSLTGRIVQMVLLIIVIPKKNRMN